VATKVFGIDLGTTYSCIAHVDRFGRPEVLANLDGELTTPSVVLFDSEQDYVVGRQAKRQARISPDHVASLVKRHMGDSSWRFTAHGREWSAPAVSSLVLRALTDAAARATGDVVTDVVITVPAYFGDEERKSTRLAGEYAGLNVVDIINEPTAAAFAYGFAQAEAGPVPDSTVLVYDLGGGTFDITVIRFEQGHIRVVATDGDHELGGADWDERMALHLSERFRAEAPDAEDPLDDSYGAQDLITSAEEAKQALSARESTDVLVIHAGARANVRVTRDDLEQLTASLLQRTIDLTAIALAAARERGADTIDRVLLVGGSSKMPAVARRLREEFGFDAQLADPDLAVAKGAAIYGQKKELERVVIDDLVARGVLNEGQTLADASAADVGVAAGGAAEAYGLSRDAVVGIVGTQVQNVCSRGFGLVLSRGSDDDRYAYFLTHRNDPLPLEVKETFFTVEDDQQTVQIQVFEQAGGVESERLDDNNILITGEITGIPAGHAKGTGVEITFSMGGDGILAVSARHLAIDQPLQLQIDTSSSLAPEVVTQERAAVSLLKPTV
jgi:molecular chaperone DnaK (HSP70)